MKALLNGFQEADRIISESAERPQKVCFVFIAKLIIFGLYLTLKIA